jgi:uncharacterized protein YqgV (UPF0045/DUF77 family)
MTTRTYTTKSGTIFEWEETNELLELLKQLHQSQSQEQQQVPST